MSNWQNAERKLAEILREYKIPAKRVTRGGDWGKSDTDIHIEGFPEYQIDQKYTKAQNFRHHGKLKEIRAKYCKNKEDVPILATRNYKEHLCVVSVEAEFFAKLLSYWLGFADKETLNGIKQ